MMVRSLAILGHFCSMLRDNPGIVLARTLTVAVRGATSMSEQVEIFLVDSKRHLESIDVLRTQSESVPTRLSLRLISAVQETLLLLEPPFGQNDSTGADSLDWFPMLDSVRVAARDLSWGPKLVEFDFPGCLEVVGCWTYANSEEWRSLRLWIERFREVEAQGESKREIKIVENSGRISERLCTAFSRAELDDGVYMVC